MSRFVLSMPVLKDILMMLLLRILENLKTSSLSLWRVIIRLWWMRSKLLVFLLKN